MPERFVPEKLSRGGQPEIIILREYRAIGMHAGIDTREQGRQSYEELIRSLVVDRNAPNIVKATALLNEFCGSSIDVRFEIGTCVGLSSLSDGLVLSFSSPRIRQTFAQGSAGPLLQISRLQFSTVQNYFDGKLCGGISE